MSSWVSLWIPHFVTVCGRPEHVVLVIKDVSLAGVLSSKHCIALAQVSFACVTLVFAYSIAILVSISVLDKLANARVAVFHSGAFDTVFVLFADGVESIDWWPVAWIRHWSVAKDETVAAISPVLALVEVVVVVGHHVDQLGVSTVIVWFGLSSYAMIWRS